jgi:hypothetical protein
MIDGCEEEIVRSLENGDFSSEDIDLIGDSLLREHSRCKKPTSCVLL